MEEKWHIEEYDPEVDDPGDFDHHEEIVEEEGEN